MKKYRIFLIQTMLILFIVTTVALLFIQNFDNYIGKYYDYESQMINYWNCLQDNFYHNFVKKKRKIVIISGSNSIFGIDYKYLNEQNKIPVLNLATHAGMGPYIFYRAKKYLNRGDIVIMPLEYEYYTHDYHMLPSNNTTFLNYIIAYDKEYYKQSSFRQKNIIQHFFISKTIWKEKRKPDFNPQNSYTMDVYTNIIVNKSLKSDCDIPYNTVKLSMFNLTHNKQNEIYKFVKYCSNNQIKVYGYFPVTYLPDNLQTKLELSKIEKALQDFYKDMEIKILGKIDENLYSKEDLYDTNYHLNSIGRKKRTLTLLKYLEKL